MSKILRIGLYLELLVILAVFSLFTGVLLANKYPRTVVETRYFPAIEKAHYSLPSFLGGQLMLGKEYHTIFCRLESDCLHEVGHLVFINQIDPEQWALDVTSYLETAEDGDLCNRIAFSYFPGICGNPPAILEDGSEWGGTVELYAEMYAWFHKFGANTREDMPNELLKYFIWE